jgi:chromosome partitioning protein
MKIAIASLKGGSGKTTTAIGLASAAHSTDPPAVLIDADPQGTALLWAEQARFEWLAISIPNRTIHTSIAKLREAAATVVVDTPPAQLGIVASAMKAADIVLIPVQPTGNDLTQIPETIALANDVAVLTGLRTALVLSRVIKRTIARTGTRATLEDQQLLVLNTEIPQSQAAALAFGGPIPNLALYTELLDELKEVAS